MRADAARNRDRILQAARTLVAEQGADASMEAIAASAGVAVGTLYRHHPTKAHLVAAVVDDVVADLAALTEDALQRVAAGAAPGTELRALFRVLAARHPEDRALKSALAVLGRPLPVDLGDHPEGSAARAAGDAITRLLAQAQRQGQVRGDVTVLDLTVLLAGVPDGPDATRDRYVEVVLAGLLPVRDDPPDRGLASGAAAG